MCGAAFLPGTELSQKFHFFGKNHLSWAASLPGADFSRISTFFGRSHLSRAASLLGADFFTELLFFGEIATCPGQLRCLPPGADCFQDFPFCGKTKNGFQEKNLPQAAKLPGASGLFKQKVRLLRENNNNLPQAAKLPGTSGFFKKNRISEKKICPRQRSCPGQVACSKQFDC